MLNSKEIFAIKCQSHHRIGGSLTMMLTTLTSCVVIASIGAKLFLQMASLRADEETSDLIPTTNATEIPLGGNKCQIFFISLNSSKFRENSIYFLFSGICCLPTIAVTVLINSFHDFNKNLFRID